MASLYTPLLAKFSGEQRADLIVQQGQWVAERDQCATDADPKHCLSQEFQARILTLRLMATEEPGSETSSL